MRLPPHQGRTARKRHEQVKERLHPFSAEIMDNLDKERPIIGEWKFYENAFGTAFQLMLLAFPIYWLLSGSLHAIADFSPERPGAKWGIFTFLTITFGLSWLWFNQFFRSSLPRYFGLKAKPFLTVTLEGVTYDGLIKGSVAWGAVRSIEYGEVVNRGYAYQYADFLGEGGARLLRVPMRWEFRQHLPATYDKSVHGSKQAITFLSFLNYYWTYWKCFVQKK